MSIIDFAERHRLKVRRDTDDSFVIPGRGLNNIYEYSDAELGVMFVSYKAASDVAHPRQWNSFSRQGQAADMVLRQNGDAEGCLSFNPADDRQAKLAIRMAGVKTKRQMSEEQRAAKAAILASARLAKPRSVPVRDGTSSS